MTALDRPFISWRRRLPWSVTASAVLLGVVLLAALFGRLVYPDPMRQDILTGLVAPGAPGHLLGTDELGRDVLAMTVAGTGSALLGPVCVAVGSMLIGILLGTLAGYERGPVDFVISRWADLLLALPLLLAAIVVGGVLGGGYWVTVILLVVLFSPSDIRIVRAGVLEQSARPYIEAAQMLSMPRWRVMFVHILPNVSTLVVTNVMLNVAFALVAFSSLSFLGVGVSTDTADWGAQLAANRQIVFDNPAAVVVPAILIILVACAVNLVGDWLGQRLAQNGTTA
ncbi:MULTISPECIES: ABC transporter permease [Mycobacteriaceae]|uniref:ABC transporter permease n=1 Tax=Mycolicibacterium parafortuitum TaxID=39692 RepID=A0ACC6MGG9_MYCPF|nr:MULTISPECIES: ABC transporter permease [Mycobacteriaceae]MCG7579476.1 ABC transporter permease [Mycolicibacterium sp. OfavD-34-C]MDZ5086056.1 ABC transporter permease [Mycolicibacterium parafortuitum]GFM21207.1 putative ABC transporter, permease [Mycobacterium sp. PO1]GFM25680.1 putative ABC transporter, permease [Mycobacterium sp. PO2]